jgi:hypothetical protein
MSVEPSWTSHTLLLRFVIQVASIPKYSPGNGHKQRGTARYSYWSPALSWTMVYSDRSGSSSYQAFYVPMLKNQIAPSLHLTTDQLTQELQAGQTLTTIASTQGISATQLPTLLASALSTTLAPVVQAGQITQQRLDQLKTRVAQNPNGLDTLLMQ